MFTLEYYQRGGKHREIPKDIAILTANQMWERRKNKPFGDRTWPAIMRLAERLDPTFKN